MPSKFKIKPDWLLVALHHLEEVAKQDPEEEKEEDLGHSCERNVLKCGNRRRHFRRVLWPPCLSQKTENVTCEASGSPHSENVRQYLLALSD